MFQTLRLMRIILQGFLIFRRRLILSTIGIKIKFYKAISAAMRLKNKRSELWAFGR